MDTEPGKNGPEEVLETRFIFRKGVLKFENAHHTPSEGLTHSTVSLRGGWRVIVKD